MRAPAVNGGVQHWTMLNNVNGIAEEARSALSRENSKNGEYGDGELKPIVYGQSNGTDGAMANVGGD